MNCVSGGNPGIVFTDDLETQGGWTEILELEQVLDNGMSKVVLQAQQELT